MSTASTPALTPDAMVVKTTLQGHNVADELSTACASHFDQMVRWNRVHNLTRITSPKEAAVSHYLDCIRAVETLRGHLSTQGVGPTPWADVGSGAGFPGVVAAAMGEDMRLIEPAKKRASFLRDASRRLGLSLSVEAIRLQEMAESVVVISRATLPWRTAAEAFERVATGGILALMVSDDASERAWSDVAESWGARNSAALSYALPPGNSASLENIQRWVLVASAG